MSSEHVSAMPPEYTPHCPECGAARISPTRQRCWLCQADLLTPEDDREQNERIRELTERIALPTRKEDHPALAAFGLLALLLGLGLLVAAPGILLILVILVTPALVRTACGARTTGPDGGPPSPVWGFLSSVGLVAIVGLASFVAFFVTCFVVCLGGLAVTQSYGVILVTSVFAGLVPGIALAILLFRRLWWRRLK